MSRDEMKRVARECLRENIPIHIKHETCAVREGCMDRSIRIMDSMESSSGKWKVDEMMKSWIKKTERLDSESRATGQNFSKSALADYAR